jgi:hypothetical protein
MVLSFHAKTVVKHLKTAEKSIDATLVHQGVDESKSRQQS